MSEEKYLRDYEIVSLDNSTDKILHTINFYPKWFDFFSKDIPIFDAKIFKILEDDYMVTSYQRWIV